MNHPQSEKHQVGIWIDHKEAFVVFHQDAQATPLVDVNETEKHVRFSGHPSEGQSPAEDQRNRRLANQLDQYYDEVIEQLMDATSILVFGPGEAKGEFKKRLEQKGFADRIVGCETSDKLTHHQIAAKVQAYFQ